MIRLYEAQRQYLASTRRARKRARRSVTPDERRAMVEAQNYTCPWCGFPLPRRPSNWTVDHIRPLSKDGADELCNMQILHQACNEAKGASWDGKSGVSTAEVG